MQQGVLYDGSLVQGHVDLSGCNVEVVFCKYMYMQQDVFVIST